MKYFVILFILSSCAIVEKKSNVDFFDRTLLLREDNSVQKLIILFGQPREILNLKNNRSHYKYALHDELVDDLEILVDNNKKTVVSAMLFCMEENDNYFFLKKKFNRYKWIESPMNSKNQHVVQELFSVVISEVGISFEYDNQDPYRRVGWISFNFKK